MASTRLPNKKHVSNVHYTVTEKAKGVETLLVAALQSAGDAIDISDATTTLKYVNSAFETLTGYSCTEAIGQSTADLFGNPVYRHQSAQPAESLYRTIEQTALSGKVWRGRVTGTRKDGSSVEQDVTVAPIYDETQSITHYVTVRREVMQSQAMEAALGENEAQFRAIAESMPVSMVVSRLEDGVILYANPHVETMFGLPPEQLLGHTSLDFYVNPSDRVILLNQLSQTGSLHNYEVHMKKADGTPFWVAVSVQKFTFNGESTLATVFHDITDRKRVETALNIRARQQAAVAELGQRALAGTELPLLMNDAVALIAQTLDLPLCGVFKRLPYCNNLLLEAGVGWQADAIGSAEVEMWTNLQLSCTLLSQQPAIIGECLTNPQLNQLPLLRDHAVASGIHVIISGDVHPFGILGCYTTQPRSFSQDDVHFLQSIAHVIATAIQRVQAETRLHIMERAIAASSNGIVITDANEPDNPITYINPAFETMTGYSGVEVLGKNCRFLQGTDTNQPGLHELRTAIRNQQECHVILRNYRKDGTLFWNELRISPVFGVNGHLTHFIGVQTDITDRVQADAAFREQQEQYRRIIETATEGIWVLDQHNNTGFVNHQMAKMLGYTIDEMVGKPLFHFMDDEGIAIANDHLNRRRQGIHEAHDFKFHCKDGTVLWAIVSTSPMFDKDGNYVGALGMLTDITERKRAEAALIQSEQRLESILSSLMDVVWSVSAENAQVLYMNPVTETIYGRSIEEFLTNSRLWLEVVHPDDRERVKLNSLELLKTGSKAIEYRIIRPDGEVRWLFDRGWVTYDEDGKPLRLDGISTDITDRKRAEEALRKSEEQFRLMFELAPIGMAITLPQGKYLAVNQAACDMLGYSPNELLDLTFVDITHPDDLAAGMALNKKLLQGELSHFQMEKRYLAKNGRVVHAILQATLVHDADGKPMQVIAQMVDITARKHMENQLIHDAFHDALTGLPNRSLFMDRLQQAIIRSKQVPQSQFAVLFLDLDRFKVVNDSLGHLVGDQLLVAIAQRLQSYVQAGDTVARLGGDEFTILLDSITTVHDATRVAEDVHQALGVPFNLNGYEVFINTSIGIALSSADHNHPEDLLRDADTALYRAKEQGKACYAVFDTAMYNQVVTLLQLETELRWAIERQELQVYYQPIVSLATGEITGFEALVRWRHPERGLISPTTFIPIAEETGLIIPIGQWVLQQACQQLQQWQHQFPSQASLTVNVNLSAKQLSQSNLAEHIDRSLRETGLNPTCLKLEITESSIMQNSESVTMLLEQLQALQVKLCLDDFGMGYSSLSRLHQFPIDTLKIDRSFISAMNQQGGKAEIVKAIITLAHNLEMDVVAEGIETVEQLKQLKHLRCEHAQGYLFGRPMDAIAAEQFLIRNLIDHRSLFLP